MSGYGKNEQHDPYIRTSSNNNSNGMRDMVYSSQFTAAAASEQQNTSQISVFFPCIKTFVQITPRMNNHRTTRKTRRAAEHKTSTASYKQSNRNEIQRWNRQKCDPLYLFAASLASKNEITRCLVISFSKSFSARPM